MKTYGKNLLVDILAIVLILLYAFVGFYKGALRMLFSIFRLTLLLILSYYLAGVLCENLVGSSLYLHLADIIENLCDNLVPGEFSSMSEVFASVGLLSNGVLRIILEMILKDITFDGVMSFGELVAPSITKIVLKVILFIIIFFVFSILFKIINYFIKKSTKVLGIGKLNRVAGFLLGGLKGFVVAMVIFIVLSTLASLGLSEGLTNFVENGTLSSYLYNNYFLAIFNLFY